MVIIECLTSESSLIFTVNGVRVQRLCWKVASTVWLVITLVSHHMYADKQPGWSVSDWGWRMRTPPSHNQSEQCSSFFTVHKPSVLILSFFLHYPVKWLETYGLTKEPLFPQLYASNRILVLDLWLCSQLYIGGIRWENFLIYTYEGRLLHILLYKCP